MQFRVRPSSKKSNNNETSLIQFPTSKSLASGQSMHFNRSLVSRLDQLQATISTMQELHKREREITNTGYIQVQKRLDKVQYKMFSTEQDLRQLNQIREIKQPRESLPAINGQPSKNEIMLLKQVILQQKEAQRDKVKHLNSQIQQLSLKLLRTEQESREMIGQQRMQIQHRLSGQGEQIREIEGLKQKKIEHQYEMMKGVIANAQRKIYEELQRKIRNQTVVKDFVQDKIAQVKQQLSSEQRQTLASETKFIKQTKQSLQTLFALVNNFKKQLSDELSQTQKLTTSSIKRLSMAMDIARQKSNDQMKQVSGLHQQVANQLVELRNFVTTRLEENRQIMSEFEQQALDRIESKGSKQSRASSNSDPQRFSLFQKEMNQWKTITEQKNLNVFKQISNTLKSMKTEWRKQNDQMVSEVNSLNESLKSLKKSGPIQLKKSVQALVSIFNNEFDVLAQQLETLTDMIALAKKQNEKAFKEDLSKIRAEVYEQIKNSVSQKGKQCNQYTDKTVGRSQQNMKVHISKQIKFAVQSLSQRLDKAETSISQLETSLKKANLLTTAQLEDYSLKLKGFNDSYKDYLQQQRKDDMKKRMELQENMRKNSSNLMDIAYKKSQFLVEGLKKNIEMQQMKQKMEATQALQVAKDQLKKQLQGARQDWQKQLTLGVEKVTKERQSSQQVLHEAIQQSINNAKRNLSNQIGNNKIEIQQKINQIKVKEVQKEAEQEQRQLELKNTVLQMLRDEKKLTAQNNQKLKQQMQLKLTSLQKAQKDKQLNDENRLLSQKKQIETFTLAEIQKIDSYHKQEHNKNKTAFQQELNQYKEETKVKFTKLQEDNKKSHEEKIKSQQDGRSREGEFDKKIMVLTQNMENQVKQTNSKIQAINSRIKENQAKVEKQRVANSTSQKVKLQEMQKKVTSLSQSLQNETKVMNQKIENLNKKMGQSQANADKQKAASASENKTKETQVQKKITALSLDFDTKNKVNTTKIEQLSKKLTEIQSNSEKKQGQGKKVGEQTLNQVKSDLQKQITKLSAKIQEIQARDKGQENDQSINAIRKSVNKLEAMTFSEQAKNKAMFDRLSEDVNKLGENLALLTNEMRQ